MKGKLEGHVAGVMVGLEAGSLVTTRKAEVRVTLEGFEGDRHAGLTRLSDSRTPHYPRGTVIRNSRQVTIVSAEELAEVAAAMGLPALPPEWLGANLCLRGVPALTHLPPSARLYFPGDAVLAVEGENLPCRLPGEVIQSRHPDLPGLATAFPKAALHKRGLVAWVERPGTIREGDTARIEVPQQVVHTY